MSTQAACPHAITKATRLVLAALVLIAVVVLARRFIYRPESPSQTVGGLKPLAIPVHEPQALPPLWLEEARNSLRGAEEARRQRLKVAHLRLTALTAEDQQRLLENICLAHGDVLNALPDKVLERNLGDPELATRIQREETLRASLSGSDDRLPWHLRREMYQDFAALTGLEEPPSLLTAFDDLTGKEMAAAIVAAKVADESGLVGMEREQWQLLLRAGAFSRFNKLVAKWPLAQGLEVREQR